MSANSEVKNGLPLILVNIAKFASAIPPEWGEKERKNLQKYYLMSLAKKLSPAHRVADCRRKIIYGRQHVEVRVSPDRKKANFANLETCSSVWDCALCGSKITEQRREELQLAIDTWSKGNQLMLLTYTLSHMQSHKLRDTLTALTEARRAFKSGRRWQQVVRYHQIVGSISAMEVTYGDNGWHPHVHELLFIKDYLLDDGQLRRFTSTMQSHWVDVLNRKGRTALKLIGLDVQWARGKVAEYVTKFGQERDDTTWTAAHELAKAAVKTGRRDSSITPRELLMAYGAGDTQAGMLWQEYSQAFKGRKQMFWSKGLAELLNLPEPKGDEEIAEDLSDTPEVFAVLTASQWRKILFAEGYGEFRHELLKIALTGDVAAFRGLLAGKGIFIE